MSQPRIATIDPPYAPDVAEDFGKLMPPGMEPLLLFRTVAHNPRVLGRMRRGGLLDKGSITPREREIMILRTCARCGAEYEWGVHVTFFSRAVGLNEAQVHATVLADGTDPSWNAAEALIVRLADALHDDSQVSDALWQELAAHYQPAQLIELIMLAGLYHAVSYVINATMVPLEKHTARFPARTPPE